MPVWPIEAAHQRYHETVGIVDIDDATRQAGARLACLAAFNHPDANALVNQALQGDVMMRRGAAQVYAHNLGQHDVKAVCQKRLLQLMHDPDEQVQAHVGECFEHLQPEHVYHLRPFIEALMKSPSLLTGSSHLMDYLKLLAADEHDLVLRATGYLLEAAGNELVDISTAGVLLEHDLARLPLIVYTHTDDQEMKSRAIDVFERLLLVGSWTARQALEDWDRR